MTPEPAASRLASAVRPTVEDDLVAARAGDESAFSRLAEPLRRELLAHCYRMLGAYHDAEDAVQETYVRAWNGVARFEGRSSLRSWLYTVATRVCLDAVCSRARRALPMDLGPAADHTILDSAPSSEVAWLTPFPDAQPEGRAERRDALELAFVAALQHLSGNQRAALLLFDVLDFSAAEIAEIMVTSTASVNSALARARRTIAASASGPDSVPPAPAVGDGEARSIAARFADALEQGDVPAFVSLLTDDVTWAMPPSPDWYRGVAVVTEFAVEVPMRRCPSWRHALIRANGQPAVAFYVGATAAGPHEAWSITVLGLRGDRVASITSFLDAAIFDGFGLPPSLP